LGAREWPRRNCRGTAKLTKAVAAASKALELPLYARGPIRFNRALMPTRLNPRFMFMISRLTLLLLVLAATSCSVLAQGRPTRFWNLTQYTISEFYLAPAGTTTFGPNQCKNDKDGTVEHDERLRITGVEAGVYDAKFTDLSGRTCVVKNLKIEVGQIFSIEENELTSACTRRGKTK